MSQGPHQVHQSSLAKVFKALASARVKARVDVDKAGKISVYVDAPAADATPAEPATDEWAIDDTN
jgi:hypothetical protein